MEGVGEALDVVVESASDDREDQVEVSKEGAESETPKNTSKNSGESGRTFVPKGNAKQKPEHDE